MLAPTGNSHGRDDGRVCGCDKEPFCVRTERGGDVTALPAGGLLLRDGGRVRRVAVSPLPPLALDLELALDGRVPPPPPPFGWELIAGFALLAPDLDEGRFRFGLEPVLFALLGRATVPWRVWVWRARRGFRVGGER